MTNDTLTCEDVATRGLVERYVAGRVRDDADQTAFETHVLTCERCREDVRLALLLRAELAAPVRWRRHRRRTWPLGVGLAVAASVTALVLLRPYGAGVRALGGVRDAPIYLGVAVRGSPTPADSLFDAAMTAYNSGDYPGAAAALQRVLAAGADSAPALFFLGVSRLLTDRAAEAADAFRLVVALGDSPYLSEAHYYLAKALLRQGNRAAALRELRAVPTVDKQVAAAAAALADSIRSTERR